MLQRVPHDAARHGLEHLPHASSSPTCAPPLRVAWKQRRRRDEPYPVRAKMVPRALKPCPVEPSGACNATPGSCIALRASRLRSPGIQVDSPVVDALVAKHQLGGQRRVRGRKAEHGRCAWRYIFTDNFMFVCNTCLRASIYFNGVHLRSGPLLGRFLKGVLMTQTIREFSVALQEAGISFTQSSAWACCSRRVP